MWNRPFSLSAALAPSALALALASCGGAPPPAGPSAPDPVSSGSAAPGEANEPDPAPPPGPAEGPPAGDDPPPPPQPQVVPYHHLESLRISGSSRIEPPEDTRRAMAQDGQNRVLVVMKMCLDDAGDVSSLEPIRSSGYAEYDQHIRDAMQGWKYRPFVVNGKPTPVCTSVTIIQ